MTTRQARKIAKAITVSDLVFTHDYGPQMPLVVIGVRPSCRYTYQQFKKAYKVTRRYYARKYKTKTEE